jgi:signal transduction histidine kinase
MRSGKDDPIELAVADTGPGITPDILPRLFQPFATRKETGLGLGLVVSQRIVEAHGGTLRGFNLPQGGACFVVRLPSRLEAEGRPLEATCQPFC